MKHLLKLSDLSKQEIIDILDLASGHHHGNGAGDGVGFAGARRRHGDARRQDPALSHC